MTRHYRFTAKDCLEISGIPYRLLKSDTAGSTWARLDQPEFCRSFTPEQFRQLIAMPDTRLKRGEYSAETAYRHLHSAYRYLQTLTDQQKSHILWKASCAEAFLDAEAKGETTRSERSVDAIRPVLEKRVNAIEESRQDMGRTARAGQLIIRRRFPSTRWLLQWVRLFEAGGYSPLVFLPKRRNGRAKRRWSREGEELLASYVREYLDRSQPTQQEIARRVQERFTEVNAERESEGKPLLLVPSAQTVRRRIKALDPFTVEAMRKGEAAAKRKFSFYEEGIKADYPLQRVEIDEWMIDIFTLLTDSGALSGMTDAERARYEVGRRWICVALDCATRCVVGFRIAAEPSAEAATDTLHLVTQDKTAIASAAGCMSEWNQHGGISTLVSDQGSPFISMLFMTVLAELHITREGPPAGVPELRARIERLFLTLGILLAPMLTGRTFRNPTERGDYPSEQMAALTDDDLARIFTLFFVDIYHNTPHAGLNGETPANAWKRLEREQAVTPPPDANQLRSVFGIPAMRKPGRHGIRVASINYTCPELQKALMRGVEGELPIRVDPMDLTYISIQIGHEWFSAEAVSNAVRGLSLDEWQLIVRELRIRYREEARLSEHIVREARKKIRKISAEACALRRVKPIQLTAEDLERLEHRIFIGLRIGPEGSAASGDLEHPESHEQADLDDLLNAGAIPASKTPDTTPKPHVTAIPDTDDDDEA